MRFFNRKPKHLSPEELDASLLDAARQGRTEAVQTLLADGADVHAEADSALCLAAFRRDMTMMKALLAAGANVHIDKDYALRLATNKGHTEMVEVIARHIFNPDFWRGKNRAEIEAEGNAIYNNIKSENPNPEHLRQTGTTLLDYALRCWEQIRPAPPKLQISPLPAKPRPV